MAVSFQCMTKFTTNKKKIIKKKLAEFNRGCWNNTIVDSNYFPIIEVLFSVLQTALN